MSLRKLQPVSFEPAIRPAQSLGKPGEFKWLKPGELVIDTKYQRDVGGRGKQNIRQIVENFEWAMFSPLVVSKRPDGLYAVIDGQHRAIAAFTHGGIEELPCWIIEGGPQKQARAFSVINGQVTAVHPLAMFRARVAAEDTEALAIVEVAKAAGVTILESAKTSSGMQPGETQSANTIGICLKRYGRDVTLAALNCVTLTGNEKGMLIEAVIGALAEVLWRAPKWREDPGLHAALRKCGLRNLYTRAFQAMAATGGVSVKKKLPDVIIAALTDKLGPVELGPAYLASAKAKEALDRGRKLGTIASARKRREAMEPPHNASRPSSARKSATRNAEIAQREQAVLRAKERRSSPAQAPRTEGNTNTDALIAEYLATKGVRRFESGATGNVQNIVAWLKREGFEARAIAPAQQSGIGKARKVFEVNGRKYTFNGFIDFVNSERKKRRLEPLTVGSAA